MMKQKKLKAGFDFDGVIAYNPLRVLRKPVNMIMRVILGKSSLEYYPQSKQSQWLWKILHKSSFLPSPGLKDLRKLLEEDKIEGYIITGRFAMLDEDLRRWLQQHEIEHLFKRIYVNKKNKFPYIFKEEMINKLKLDYFLEDNWDVIKYLNRSLPKQSKTQLHWIYNIIDHFIPYKNKHPHLSSFLTTITKK